MIVRLFARTLVFLFVPTLEAATAHLAAVRDDLQKLAIDPSEVWRVRDLQIARGGAKIYFSEGVLAFATPVDGHRVAAIFTTALVDAGDAEVIALPPIPAERASLAHFTKSPNLDEHFNSALLFFADDTASELVRQIHQNPLHPAPDLAPSLSTAFNDSLARGAAEIDVRITQSILDRHTPSGTFLYCMMNGRSLGPFDFIYQPDQADHLVFGRIAGTSSENSYFQIWSAFRPQGAPETAPRYQISNYHIDTTVHPDLSMSSAAAFDYESDADDGAVITLLLTPRLHVTSATIDDHVASVVTHESALNSDPRGADRFLVVNDTELPPGTKHHVTVRYEGSVIRRVPNGSYFVDDRNAWYPFIEPMLTVYDLVFRCPEQLRLFSSGDPVSEQVAGGQRVVHRRTASPVALAGFNIGEFEVSESNAAVSGDSGYHVAICSNPSAKPAPNLADQTAQILHYFSARWTPLTSRSVAVTPIEGYFGQGFPGLIYLSSMSYLRDRDRPAGLRGPIYDSFFSQLLLPHELAHQWWGNIVTALDYHSNWIVEAMSNYSALQYLEETQGRPALDAIIAAYRLDLTTPGGDGELVDGKGPVTFGQRLLNNYGTGVWHDILYEKGTWIFHMLRNRMGDNGFRDFQLRLLHDFAKRPISNQDLEEEAARFIPANQPDRQLKAFFDTWVYDTGIPKLVIKGNSLLVSNVPETYTVDLPIACRPAAKSDWMHITEGEIELPSRNCSLPDLGRYLFRH